MCHQCMYVYINLTCSASQANSKNSTGCVRLDINLLKPSRIEFAEGPGSCALPITARWTPCHPKVVGVRIQDCTSCPAMAANQIGRVDW